MKRQPDVHPQPFPANHPDLQRLFDASLPNSPALWAVLQGKYRGHAVVDDAQTPTQCVVRTNAALTYFCSQTRQEFLDAAVVHFRGAGAIWLVWPHQTCLNPPEIGATTTVNRLEFYETNPDVLSDLRKQLPAEFSIRDVDEQLLARCHWRNEIEFYAGSVANFLTHGIGICMMQGDETIVEAYASSLGKIRAEIGAITTESYRGQGYAPIACAYLIELCAQQGYHGYWSCEADHTASVRVAQKLGFQQERAYRIFEYDAVP